MATSTNGSWAVLPMTCCCTTDPCCITGHESGVITATTASRTVVMLAVSVTDASASCRGASVVARASERRRVTPYCTATGTASVIALLHTRLRHRACPALCRRTSTTRALLTRRHRLPRLRGRRHMSTVDRRLALDSSRARPLPASASPCLRPWALLFLQTRGTCPRRPFTGTHSPAAGGPTHPLRLRRRVTGR